jgi:hypothetical protein
MLERLCDVTSQMTSLPSPSQPVLRERLRKGEGDDGEDDNHKVLYLSPFKVS